MTCLQHRFSAHPTLQRWLFCEYCGAAKELGAETKARAAQPRQRKREQPQPTLFDERQEQNELEADAFIAKREAEALRNLRDAGVDTSEGIEGIIARNGGTQRDLLEGTLEDVDSSLATTTRIFG